MRFQNFHIWRGRLPHWRADEVTYFVTFRHRRPLDSKERLVLYQSLMRPEGRKLDYVVLLVLPEKTEMLFKVREAPTGLPFELSDIIESAKTKAGRKIVKLTEERFPPFYIESYDRIIRDEGELQERFDSLLAEPVDLELCEEPEEFQTLYVAGAPD